MAILNVLADMTDWVACDGCGESLDPTRNHYVELLAKSVDLETAATESHTRIVCVDCGRNYVDFNIKQSTDMQKSNQRPKSPKQ